MAAISRATVSAIPLLSVRAGPRDGDAWTERLKEELAALVAYVRLNKEQGNEWFTLRPENASGTKWTGTVWYVHTDYRRYEFGLEFEVPATYPVTAPELAIPSLEGLTPKMYRGGKICQTVHFKPLWAKNVPRFGLAHALALGMAPWLAAEIPFLVESGRVVHPEDAADEKEGVATGDEGGQEAEASVDKVHQAAAESGATGSATEAETDERGSGRPA